MYTVPTIPSNNPRKDAPNAKKLRKKVDGKIRMTINNGRIKPMTRSGIAIPRRIR
jgi:hypothetical protein